MTVRLSPNMQLKVKIERKKCNQHCSLLAVESVMERSCFAPSSREVKHFVGVHRRMLEMLPHIL